MADINIKFSGDGPTSGGGGRSPDLQRLGEVLNAFADKVEKAISKINKSGSIDSKKAAREFKSQYLKDRNEAKKADRADRVAAQKKIYTAKTASMKGIFTTKETQSRKTKELEYLKKKEILQMKQTLSDKQHLQRLERDKTRHEQGLKSIAANAATAALTAGGATLAYAVRNIISTLGTSSAAAALTNNANPAGSTLASYYGQNISAASTGIQAGTGLGAVAIGGAVGGIPGAIAGAIIGTILSGVESALGANFNSGYQLNTQRKYLGDMLGTVYGSQFGSISSATLKGGQLIQGTDNLSAIAGGLSGRVFGKNAFTAGAYGSAIAAYYGNELGQAPQIANSVGTIAQLSGKGNSGSSISQYLQQLISLQVQYGGDMSANLKNISDLLAGSSIKSAAAAASTVYKNNLLGPGFAGAANNYLMSGPLEQFATRTMLKGLTGVDINDLTGSNGAKKAAALRKLQAYIGPNRTGGSNTRAFAAEAILGGASQFYGFDNAHAGNLSMANHPMNQTLRKTVASNLNTLARGAAPSESQVKGMYDQSTQQVVGMRSNSMQVEATTVKIYGTINNATNPIAGYEAFRSRKHGGI